VKAGFLLDVNVLIAMAWPTHRAHEKAQEWLCAPRARGWATCPLTQIGFVRILSNPAFLSKRTHSGSCSRSSACQHWPSRAQILGG